MEAERKEWEGKMWEFIAKMRLAADHLQEMVEGPRGCKCMYEEGDHECNAMGDVEFLFGELSGWHAHCCTQAVNSENGCCCDVCDPDPD